MATCGLDFGTSNSAVALPSGDVLRIDHANSEPRLFRSVLFFPEQATGYLAGTAAIDEYFQRSDGRFIQSIKGWLSSGSFTATQIRGRAYKLEDLVAILLRTIREHAERERGTALDDVTLGRPALFATDPSHDALAERRLLRAAELAGFKRIRFLIEPIAAALAYEATLVRDELVLQRTLKGLRNTVVLPKGWEVSGVSQSATIGSDRNGRVFVSLINLNAENTYTVTIRAKKSS